ncbi:MAG: hypothetical protein H6711_34875 [Myxococcales bacterium]|nr:hypothetical protein [Myxococcales bacterium]
MVTGQALAMPAAAPGASAEAPAPAEAPAAEGPAPAEAPAAEAPAPIEAPAPEPEPEPEAAPLAPAPAPAAEGPIEQPPAPMSPAARAKAEDLRRAGKITIGAGGVLGAAGLIVMVGYTIQGHRLANDLILAQEEVQKNNCSRGENAERCGLLNAQVTGIEGRIESADSTTRMGGFLLLGGVAVAAVGGVLYGLGTKRLKRSEFVLAPSVGGAVLSGRF